MILTVYIYKAFKIVIEWHINLFAPQKQVALSSITPLFVTPLIKSLLRMSNKLMRCGQVHKADDLTAKIGRLISDKRPSLLQILTLIVPNNYGMLSKPLVVNRI